MTESLCVRHSYVSRDPHLLTGEADCAICVEDRFPYECPDCGERHDGMSTGTELCPDCEQA